MKTFNLNINEKKRAVQVEPDTPLLWVLRDALRLTGTKFGCGLGVCGACTVHLDGKAARACTIEVSEIGNARITTIEGLSKNGEHPVQRAWLAEEVAQCGYCQPGQIMQASALLAKNKKPSDAEIDEAMKDNHLPLRNVPANSPSRQTRRFGDRAMKENDWQIETASEVRKSQPFASRGGDGSGFDLSPGYRRAGKRGE